MNVRKLLTAVMWAFGIMTAFIWVPLFAAITAWQTRGIKGGNSHGDMRNPYE